uniref:Nucleolar protein 4 like n=1 Tax=Meleagris gallopavo TaxID=9103 RepID=A0A803XWI8_MELGA
MHVESSTEPGKAPKHAGQKKTYRAIAETYAFLPREAVTRFLMSCTECQKRMHFNSNGLEPKESEPPSSLVSGIIDYNMPLTSTYLKQMKLRVMNSQEQVSYPPAMGQCKARGGFLPLGLGSGWCFWEDVGRCFWKCCVCPGGAGFDHVQPVLVHGSGAVLLLWIVAVCLFFRHVVLL